MEYLKITERFIPHIEEAVGFKLYEAQKRYLIEGVDVFQGRRSGRTVAHAIKEALTEGSPLDFRKPYKNHFEREFLKYREMLYNYGFPVRPIIIAQEERNYKMNTADEQYLALCQHILENGVRKEDRTGTGTLSVFGHQMRFNLAEGFPLLTTKKVHFPAITHELLWFLSGSTDIKYLLENNVNIWNGDAYRDFKKRYGNSILGRKSMNEFIDYAKNKGFRLGPIYGEQWRSWDIDGQGNTIDQIQNVIDSIMFEPDSRRHIVSAWNVGDLEYMALPPCHLLFQFYVANGKLSCQLYLRSSDVFLGLPFNIASYAMLVHMIGQVTDLEVGELIITIGDAHIYTNHIEQVEQQLKRKARSLPELKLDKEVSCINDFAYEHIEVINYNPHPAIKGNVSTGVKGGRL